METRDIVERLRDGGNDICRDGPMWPGDDMLEAAAEIERLRSALSTAREAGRREGLEEAAKVADEYDFRSNTEEDVQAYRIATAIRALKEKQPTE